MSTSAMAVGLRRVGDSLDGPREDTRRALAARQAHQPNCVAKNNRSALKQKHSRITFLAGRRDGAMRGDKRSLASPQEVGKRPNMQRTGARVGPTRQALPPRTIAFAEMGGGGRQGGSPFGI